MTELGLRDLEPPPFVHEFSDTGHTYRGSYGRHVAFERILFKLAKPWWDWDASRVYDLLSFFLELGLGLNCGFPPRDVMLYALCSFKFFHQKYWR